MPTRKREHLSEPLHPEKRREEPAKDALVVAEVVQGRCELVRAVLD